MEQQRINQLEHAPDSSHLLNSLVTNEQTYTTTQASLHYVVLNKALEQFQIFCSPICTSVYLKQGRMNE
jgi:hypothetical protein